MGDPVHRYCEERGRSWCTTKLALPCLLAASFAAANPAATGAWKHEMVANDGDVLT
jgi:hypothetical protein